MPESFVDVSTRVTVAMRDGLDNLAKEYNVTRSEMLRILIAEVVDDDAGDDGTRSYSRKRKRKDG